MLYLSFLPEVPFLWGGFQVILCRTYWAAGIEYVQRKLWIEYVQSFQHNASYSLHQRRKGKDGDKEKRMRFEGSAMKDGWGGHSLMFISSQCHMFTSSSYPITCPKGWTFRYFSDENGTSSCLIPFFVQLRRWRSWCHLHLTFKFCTQRVTNPSDSFFSSSLPLLFLPSFSLFICSSADTGVSY